MLAWSLAGVIALLLAGCAAGATVTTQEPVVSPSPPSLGRLPSDLAQRITGPWSATPLTLSDEVVAAIDAQCRLVDSLTAAFDMMVIDVRGEGAFSAFYANPDRAMQGCLHVTIGPSGELEGPLFGSGLEPGRVPVPAPAEIRVVDHSWVEAPIDASFIGGVVGPNIVRIEIDRLDENDVVASLANGWFAAWAPGHLGPRIRGYDGTGAIVVDQEL